MPDEIITPSQVADVAKAQALHPSMGDVKSLPGYREHADGTWSAPANGAWGEAMRPHWRAGHEAYCNRTGQSYERTRIRATRRYVNGVWYRRAGSQWLKED